MIEDLGFWSFYALCSDVLCKTYYIPLVTVFLCFFLAITSNNIKHNSEMQILQDIYQPFCFFHWSKEVEMQSLLQS